MTSPRRIAFFGSSILSAYWNGAATYYRGLVRQLAERGHHVVFFEPDAFDRGRFRDLEDPDWVEVVVYPAEEGAARSVLDRASDADVVVKASGVGVLDHFLESEVVARFSGSATTVFWDVDAPATLSRLEEDDNHPLRRLVSRFDAVFTYGGGEPVTERYNGLGARHVAVVYNAADPQTHHPVDPDPRFEGALGFLGNRLPDREERVRRFFLDPATGSGDGRFLLGGAGWDPETLPGNVEYLGHVPPNEHNAFNVTPTAILNIHRESMIRNGFAPATRMFEAGVAGACMISDSWAGIDFFLEPGREILVAEDGRGVSEILEALDDETAEKIGAAARERILAEHTYAHRAAQVEGELEAIR
ncbi:MAG: glycosyltransferase [Actinobacteria bacterium]|nr:glycosyltransferase [Actinomycetota bacterium]